MSGSNCGEAEQVYKSCNSRYNEYVQVNDAGVLFKSPLLSAIYAKIAKRPLCWDYPPFTWTVAVDSQHGGRFAIMDQLLHCPRCGKEKPFTDFCKDSKRKSGRNSYCRECVREYNKRYVGAAKEFSRIRREKDGGETNRKYAALWVKKYPKKEAARQQKRRARKNGASGSFTGKEFQELCERYGNRCLACGRKTKLTADHIVPLSKGGDNSISNIQPLCKPCNSKKWVQAIDYRPDKPGSNGLQQILPKALN